MKSLILCVRWALALSLLSVVSVNAAVFIKIGDIKGESQVAGHEEEIDVLSWSWGVERPIDTESGSTRTRASSEFLDLEVGKLLEKATPKLVEACATGKVFPEAILVIEKESQAGGAFKVLEIKLLNASITSDRLTGSVEAIESVRLDFEKVEMRYFVQNPDGSAGGTVEMSYDLALGQ